MEFQTPNSNAVNESRCQKRTRNGRCRMPVADTSSRFCAEHDRIPSRTRSSADLSTLLTAGLTEFKSALPINDFLSRLLLHQAVGLIPPRRAAVMAYTCNLLLRTLPAIEHEQKAEPVQFIFDLPRPKLDDEPVVDLERDKYKRMAERFGIEPNRPRPEASR